MTGLQRILRLVVAVVMAGVLPLQGWAAASMAGCGSTETVRARAPVAAEPAFLTDGLERPPRTTDA